MAAVSMDVLPVRPSLTSTAMAERVPRGKQIMNSLNMRFFTCLWLWVNTLGYYFRYGAQPFWYRQGAFSHVRFKR